QQLPPLPYGRCGGGGIRVLRGDQRTDDPAGFCPQYPDPPLLAAAATLKPRPMAGSGSDDRDISHGRGLAESGPCTVQGAVALRPVPTQAPPASTSNQEDSMRILVIE